MFLSLSFLFFFFWMGKHETSCRRMAARQAGAIAMSSDSAPLFGGVSGYIPITSHPCGELQLTHCPEQDFPHHNPKSGVLGWDRGAGGSSQEAAPPPPFWALGVRGGTCSSSDPFLLGDPVGLDPSVAPLLHPGECYIQPPAFWRGK